ncbi:hypothetical protein [Thioalkalivibrio sp. ALE16]|uniref:hypothetical protein n=1 Tax=Thioalkalivibrio sp. ALE16 TaxID=1158172 RepID=UPI00037C9907|nr:hypothetical protein [Thioalkalivibrio sp. ALE16]
MPNIPTPRLPGRALTLALLLAATATGCGLLPVEQERPAATEDRPATTAEPVTDPDGAADTPAADEATPEEPSAAALSLATSEHAESERRVALREQGHETLEPARVGYYVDVLGARLRQELAGQPATIEHRDAGIHVTLNEGNGQAHALDTIGHLLHEFRASLITLVAYRDGPDPDSDDGAETPAAGDALNAGKRLQDAGVAPERLVLRSMGTGTVNTNPGSPVRTPRLELLIQPLTTS